MEVVEKLREMQGEINPTGRIDRMEIEERDEVEPQSIRQKFNLEPDELITILNSMPNKVNSGHGNGTTSNLKDLVRFNPIQQGVISDSDRLLLLLVDFVNRTITNPDTPKYISAYIGGGGSYSRWKER
jgi:hypothetical protein